MKFRIIQDPNGFFYPQVEENFIWKYIVVYGTFENGKWKYPPRFETYETPIAGHCNTEEKAQSICDLFVTAQISHKEWKVISEKEI